MIDSERVRVDYYVRSASEEWLLATLDPGERLEVECGPVRASIELADIYADTDLIAV